MPKTILITDDNADIRSALRLLLGAEFDIVEASDGREAVELAEKERPSLILLDIDMPGMDGLAALGAIKARDPAALVIMLTSRTEIETAIKAVKLGAAAYVTKPFDMEFVRAEARRLTSSEPVDKSGRPWRVGA